MTQALSAAGESFTCGYVFGLLSKKTHATCLFEGGISAAATLIDDCIAPYIPRAHPRIDFVIRHVVVILTLNACGAHILLVNTVVSRLLWDARIADPTYLYEHALNAVLKTVSTVVFSNGSLHNAFVRSCIAVSAIVIDEFLRPYFWEGFSSDLTRSAIAFITIRQCTDEKLSGSILLHVWQPVMQEARRSIVRLKETLNIQSRPKVASLATHYMLAFA